MQQVRGAGKRIGMQPVSRVGEPVALGEDQIFSDKHPSGMLLLPPNIRLARRKKGDRDLLRGARVRSLARRRADKYALRFNISRSRLNFKRQSGGYTSGRMFLPTRVKRKSLCRSRKRGSWHRSSAPCIQFLSSPKMRRQPSPNPHPTQPFHLPAPPFQKKKRSHVSERQTGSWRLRYRPQSRT